MLSRNFCQKFCHTFHKRWVEVRQKYYPADICRRNQGISIKMHHSVTVSFELLTRLMYQVCWYHNLIPMLMQCAVIILGLQYNFHSSELPFPINSKLLSTGNNIVVFLGSFVHLIGIYYGSLPFSMVSKIYHWVVLNSTWRYYEGAHYRS